MTKIINFKDKLENKREVQQFLGIINYASDHLKDLPKLRKPLQELTKNKPFVWTEEHEKCIKTFKERVKTLPKHRILIETDHLELFTDASDIGLGSSPHSI